MTTRFMAMASDEKERLPLKKKKLKLKKLLQKRFKCPYRTMQVQLHIEAGKNNKRNTSEITI